MQLTLIQKIVIDTTRLEGANLLILMEFFCFSWALIQFSFQSVKEIRQKMRWNKLEQIKLMKLVR